MIPKLLLLTAKMLQEASHHYANHGCNDMDQELLGSIGFTDAEKLEICEKYAAWNGDPGEEHKFENIPDFAWLSFLANMIDPRGDK